MTFVERAHSRGGVVVLYYEEDGGQPPRSRGTGGRNGLPIIRDPEPPEGANV